MKQELSFIFLLPDFTLEIIEEDSIDDIGSKGITYQPADEFISFDSIEEFEEYLSFAKPGDDQADLASLEKYYLPLRIPKEYKLYKIIAGSTDISFRYLPENCLTDESSIRMAESQNKYFCLILPRYESTLESIFNQFDASEDERSNNYFVYRLSRTDHIFWEQDDIVLNLCIPKEFSQSEYDPADYCHAEAIYVK